MKYCTPLYVDAVVVSSDSCAESTSALIVSPVLVLDESASEFAPSPVLNRVIELVVEVPVSFNLTVDPDMSVVKVAKALDPVCVIAYSER